MNEPQDLAARIGALLSGAGLPATIHSIAVCAQGGNNRTYQVTTGEGRFAVKHYFRHQDDARDRLATEFAFLSVAREVAPEFVAKAYAMDAASGIALYEFIDGERLQPGGVGAAEVAQAGAFFKAINSAAARAAAARLADASEACFSINDHLELISSRLARLSEIPVEAKIDGEAVDLVRSLSAHWRDLARTVTASATRAGIDLTLELAAGQRCISPSDFGFHNALRGTDGRLKFLDFEYAGWDDPAKMTGDFFAQIALPVPGELFPRFAHDAMQSFAHPAELVRRAELLRPVYWIKWCCISLNSFLPLQRARRRFSDPGMDEAAEKRIQLEKAKAHFNSMERIGHGLR